MSVDIFGKFYTAALSVYFIFSGFNALYDIDAKLLRIGLTAASEDGKIAFILIYCSLMIGIGVAMALIYLASGTWFYSCLIAVVIVLSFIVFRFVGSYIVGEVSNTQLSFIVVELVEFSVGVWVLFKSQKIQEALA